MNTRHLQFFITAESPCGYFDDRMSSNLVPDPELSISMPIYNRLIQHGFRRSGSHCYRPHCENSHTDCRACVACRILVNKFTASRSQKRCLKSNLELTQTVVDASFNEEYFELYRRYLNSRHIGGSMTDPVEEDFKQFLYSKWSDTRFLEFRHHERLVAVAVTDVVSNGISAVYSFFEPEMAKHGLGTYCILKQIEYAKELKLDYVYLGYWIKDHPKMHYKNKFKPLQLYLDEQWKNIDEELP